MSKWNMVKLGSINNYQSKSINPMKEPNRKFELYSVPSYEYNYPEILTGAEIGSTKQTVQEGDILLCKINPRINRVWYVMKHTKYPLIASSEWIVIRNNDIFSDYLVWCLRSSPFRNLLETNVTGIGGSLTRVQPKQVKEYLIPLPPFETQKQIAKTLDTAAELLAMRKQQLAELDNLIKSTFYDVFGDPVINEKGWKVKKLAELIVDVKNGITRRGRADLKGSIVLKLKDIRENYIDFSDVNKFTLNQTERDLFQVTYNQLLFVRVNGNPNYVGRCAVFTGFDQRIFYNDHIMRVTIKEEIINPTFLSCLLNFPYGKKEIKNHLKTSAGQYTINQQGLSNIVAPLPPLSLQTQFAAIVTKIEEQKTLLKKAINETQTLFESLMSEYFE